MRQKISLRDKLPDNFTLAVLQNILGFAALDSDTFNKNVHDIFDLFIPLSKRI